MDTTTVTERPDYIDLAVEDEMGQAYLDYAMAVILGRAVPDIRDGLKPVHRRILYAMKGLGLSPSRSYKKCATVVGEVLGKYHPHGDQAVYDSLVRMAQDFSLRYPLIDGQGNFGSIDGDPAAAYRYTEARLEGTAVDILADLDKGTVEYKPNFDDRQEEPEVLPGRFPNLLANGVAGIAVGLATNIPPHNIREITQAIRVVLSNPDAETHELMEVVKGPDFPTGGCVHGLEGIREAYETGRGRITVRAKVSVEEDEDGRGERLVVNEIPYMVNKERLVIDIARQVNEKKLDGIRDLRDESDRDGIRIVIELKRDAIPRIVLNHLFKQTQLQVTFAAQMIAIEAGRPKMFTLKSLIGAYINHRRDMIQRRSLHLLKEAEDRLEILRGLQKAVDAIDRVIQIIRGSKDTTEAAEKLMTALSLNERQAKAILDMRLGKLTGLEMSALVDEANAVEATAEDLREIIASDSRKREIIEEDLDHLDKKYGDERRTAILPSESEINMEDLIPNELSVVTLTKRGYIKRIAVSEYRSQRRGGRGVSGMQTRDGDEVVAVFSAMTHDDLLFFTEGGHVYRLKVYEIPEGSRQSLGKPVVNILPIDRSEKLARLLSVPSLDEAVDLIFLTENGRVKRTELSAFGNIRSNGLIAMGLHEGDRVLDVQTVDPEDEVVLTTKNGVVIRFDVTDVKRSSRNTYGVRGIKLREKDQLLGLAIPRDSTHLVFASEKGYGKRVDIDEIRNQNRGGFGVRGIRLTKATGPLVGARAVTIDHDLILLTHQGIVNRQTVEAIPSFGRSARGVRLLNLDEKDRVVDLSILNPDEEEDLEDEDLIGEATDATDVGDPDAPESEPEGEMEVVAGEE